MRPNSFLKKELILRQPMSLNAAVIPTNPSIIFAEGPESTPAKAKTNEDSKFTFVPHTKVNTQYNAAVQLVNRRCNILICSTPFNSSMHRTDPTAPYLSTSLRQERH